MNNEYHKSYIPEERWEQAFSRMTKEEIAELYAKTMNDSAWAAALMRYAVARYNDADHATARREAFSFRQTVWNLLNKK